MSRILMSLSVLAIAACASADVQRPFAVKAIAEFDEPWAMAFLPDGRLLVTEKAGRLLVVDDKGNKSPPVSGVPAVDYGGQGGLGDVALHPEFPENGLVYLSYVEAGKDDTRGAAVVRGVLDLTDGGSLSNIEIIWRQDPKVTGRGHYGHRLLFDDEGHLFISSGDRQKFDPAQDMDGNLGKIVRLYDDGSVPKDNPFYSDGGVTAQIWSLGHRNPLGIAFDLEGQLWNMAMNSTGSSAGKITATRSSPTAIITAAKKSRTTTRGPSLPHPRCGGRRSSHRADSWFTRPSCFQTGAATDSSPDFRRNPWCGSNSRAARPARLNASTWASACAPSRRGRTERSGCWKTSKAGGSCG